MDKNKIIIIALIAIIAALLVGWVAMMPNTNKEDAKLTFKNNATLTKGDPLKIKLTDVNGTAIENQTVNVTITDKNNTSDYHSAVTNTEGIGSLNLNKSAGEYEVTISYSGNDKYNSCNATKKITIEEEVVEEGVVVEESTTQQSTQSSRSSNELHYDPEVNVYYDSNGIIVDPDGQHGQGFGSRYSDVREARDRWERGEPVMV